MNELTKVVATFPELQDQIDLLNNTLKKEGALKVEHRNIVAWAAAVGCQNTELLAEVLSKTGELSADDKRSVAIANSRMSVTNPYFMGRNIFPVKSGGTLDGLNFRPFPELNIKDDVGYHYACTAVSSVNGGYMCFSSHMNSLQSSGQSDEAIDQAQRITAAVLAIKQLMFMVHLT